MLFWILAVVVLVSVCIVGWYQGAVRGTVSTLGLFIAAALAMPLSGVMAAVLRIFKLEHPIVLGFLAPVIAFLLLLVIFKVAGFAAHRKLDTFYKYHESDTRRLLFERLNQRVGVCVGVINGTIYVFLLAIAIYVLGYGTTQLATTSDAPFLYRVVNSLAAGVQSSGMTRAIAGLDPAPESYYEGADILADVFHTPLLQQRLSSYPPFLMLAERPEFQEMAQDTGFQEMWTRQPSLTEFTKHPRIQPLIRNVKLYKEVTDLVKDQLPDLHAYLTTGVSPQYKEQPILARWKFDLEGSYNRANQLKRNMPLAEKRFLRTLLLTKLKDSTLTATIDQSIHLKTPVGTEQGKWSRAATGKYQLSTSQGEVEASVEGRRLYLTLDNIPVIFRKT